ncbi:hypothetical protein P7C70_g7053, partial [Phenoliferia sp. Uapishka_3]
MEPGKEEPEGFWTLQRAGVVAAVTAYFGGISPQDLSHHSISLRVATKGELRPRNLVQLCRSAAAGVQSSSELTTLRIVDVKQGVLGIEWIEGWSVREVLGGGQEEAEALLEEGEDDEEEEGEDEDVAEHLKLLGVHEDDLLFAIGGEIAKMHLAEVIHGDLTTSNMMVRLLPRDSSPEKRAEYRKTASVVFEIVSASFASRSIVVLTASRQVLIDFGLSSSANVPEDRAVDLYVLERAFSSTHPVPRLESGEEGVPHFERVLLGYQRAIEQLGKKGDWDKIEKRLEDVRGRGRKRSMVG